MSRKNKLLRNVAIISVLLYGFYYFGGFYISKEQCVIETMRGLYVEEKNYVMEVINGNEIKTLFVDDSNETVSIIGTKQLGFLYRTSGSYTSHSISRVQAIDVISGYNSEAGQTIFVYRNNKEIAYIEVELSDGTNLVLDEWNDDFVGTIVDAEDWNSGIYKVYNANGNLIDVIEY